MKKRKKLNKKIKFILFIILYLILSATLFISLFNIIKWAFFDVPNTSKIIEHINTQVEIKNEPIKIIEKKGEYWEYKDISYIDVDLNKLKEINNDVKGWINMEGTNINYPFVQTTNNEYYLNKSFNKKNNSAGWLFLDYRNNSNLDNKNMIIYGHNRKDLSMFGSLKNILNNNFFNTEKNNYVKLSLFDSNSVWQVFSYYVIDTTSDYIQTEFYSNEEYVNFLNMIKNRSYKNFNIELNENDKILTLSTCRGNTKKLVLHAVLISNN